MQAAEIEQQLRNKLRSWAVADDKLDGAIYQHMGINGMDFYDLLCEIQNEFELPNFVWEEFADMSEPPDGLTFWRVLTFRGPKILQRKQLTLAHLSNVIAQGQWSEP